MKQTALFLMSEVPLYIPVGSLERSGGGEYIFEAAALLQEEVEDERVAARVLHTKPQRFTSEHTKPQRFASRKHQTATLRVSPAPPPSRAPHHDNITTASRPFQSTPRPGVES